MFNNVLFGLMALLIAQYVDCAVHETRSGPPSGWSASVAPFPADTAAFTLALKIQNLDKLESELLAVSDPDSPSYGAHWGDDAVSSAFRPSNQTIFNVVKWLQSSSIREYRVDGAFVDFRCDITTANTLFNASYYYYTNLGVVKLRTLSYSIPDEIQDDVTLVDPGTYFGSIEPLNPIFVHTSSHKAGRHGSTNASAVRTCERLITPPCLQQMYSTTGYVPTADSQSSIGFGGFLNQKARYDDLLQFEEHNGIPAQNISVQTFAGAENNQSSTEYTEANLDAQVIVGLAHPLNVTEYITGGSPPFQENLDHPTDKQNYNEPWVPYYRNLLATPVRDIPQVLSHSYGDLEDSVPRSYATLTCNLIGMMGLRGITIIQASGDSGVGAGCLATDFKTVQFDAIFPATCPWVTSVGGTAGLSPERAWNASSGGFSNYFSRPAYQADAIAAYMNSHVAPAAYAYYGQYTRWGGRGFPDVAAHSTGPDFEVVYAGQRAASGGTSASAPVWAAIAGLLNDARLAAGKPVLGWLNPLIYRYGPSVLNDITEGHTVGCNGVHPGSGVTEPEGAGIVPGARWNATAGWDTTTGFGTPDFARLKALVLTL